MLTLAAASAWGAQRPAGQAPLAAWDLVRETPISTRVSLGCTNGEGFVARVLAQAGERSATRFALGSGFVAIYRDRSWIHVAELAQPCIVASGSGADMITYFEIE